MYSQYNSCCTSDALYKTYEKEVWYQYILHIIAPHLFLPFGVHIMKRSKLAYIDLKGFPPTYRPHDPVIRWEKSHEYNNWYVICLGPIGSPDNPLRRRSMSVTASSLGSRPTPHHSPKSLSPSCHPDFCIHPGPVVHQNRVSKAFLSPAKRDKRAQGPCFGSKCDVRANRMIYLYAHKGKERA